MAASPERALHLTAPLRITAFLIYEQLPVMPVFGSRSLLSSRLWAILKQSASGMLSTAIICTRSPKPTLQQLAARHCTP